MNRYDPPPDSTALGCLGCLVVLAVSALVWLSVLRLLVPVFLGLHR